MSALLLLVACIDGLIPDLPVPTTDTATTTTDTDTTPITYVNDDEGSVVMIQWLPHVEDPNPVTVGRAMFVSNAYDVLNLAQCVGLRDLWCATDWPENYGDVVQVTTYDADFPDLISLLDSTFVGDPLPFGPWTLNHTNDASFDLDVYVRFYDSVEPASGPLNLTLGGEWNEWAGDIVEAPTPFELTSHDPLVRQEFMSNELLELTWEPGTSGDIFLYVEAPNGRYLQRLEDTGSTSLDLTVFNIDEGDDISLYIGRWAEATVDLNGNTVNAQVQINQWLHGTYRAFGQREDLDGRMFDDCSTAVGAPPLPEGIYVGDLAGYVHDFNPPSQDCTGDVAPGRDAIIPVRLQSNDYLEVEYEPLHGGINGDDAVLYLVTESFCDAGPGECLIGADNGLGGFKERVGYRNESAFAEDLYIVVDNYLTQNPRDNFYLNVGIEPSLSDPLVSSCADAITQGPIQDGSYYGQMGSFPNLLQCDPDGQGQSQNPPVPGTGAGGDGKAEIYLLPGQTVTAKISGSGDPYLYMVYNCSLASSCIGGSQSGSSTLTYTNGSAVAESVYLVVDSVDFTGTVQDYFLDIEIQ